MIKSTRKIKCLGNCTEHKYLHPISLQIYKNEDNLYKCPTELYYDKNKKTYSQVKSCDINKDKLTSLERQKFMALPYLNLDLDIMLSIYKIDTIDSLIEWVSNMIKEDKPFRYVNRIVNIWIKSNYDSLVKKNIILNTVYAKINENYWKKKNTDRMSEIIKTWFKTKNIDDFNFDLGTDLLDELDKK
jgi:hypothetical protein